MILDTKVSLSAAAGSSFYVHFFYSLFCHFLVFCLIVMIPLQSGRVGAAWTEGVSVFLSGEQAFHHAAGIGQISKHNRESAHAPMGRISGSFHDRAAAGTQKDGMKKPELTDDGGGYPLKAAALKEKEKSIAEQPGKSPDVTASVGRPEVPRPVVSTTLDRQNRIPDQALSNQEEKSFNNVKKSEGGNILRPAERVAASDTRMPVTPDPVAVQQKKQLLSVPVEEETIKPSLSSGAERPQISPPPESLPRPPVPEPILMAKVESPAAIKEQPSASSKKHDEQGLEQAGAAIESKSTAGAVQISGSIQQGASESASALQASSDLDILQQGAGTGSGKDKKNQKGEDRDGGKGGQMGASASAGTGGMSSAGDGGSGVYVIFSGEGAGGGGAPGAQGGQGDAGKAPIYAATSASEQVERRAERKSAEQPIPEALVRKDIRIVAHLRGSGAPDMVTRLTRKTYPSSQRKKVIIKEEEVKFTLDANMLDTGNQVIKHALSVGTAEKGQYSFTIMNLGKEGYETEVLISLYEGRKENRLKEYKKIALDAGSTIRFRFILPDAVFWDDAFSFVIEDSNSITKVLNESGLVWKEEKEKGRR